MADFEVPAGTVVLETALDYEELDRELKSGLPKRGQQAGEAAGEGFRRGFDQAVGDDAGKKVEKTLEGAEKGSRKAREAFEETGAGAADMGEALEGATESAGGLAAIAGTRLVKGLRGLTGWVGRTTSSFLTLSGVGVRELGEGLRQMGRELAESDSRLRALGKGAEVAGGALEGLGAVMISVASSITGAKIAVAGLAAAMITMAKRAEDRFRPSWNRVLTLIPEGTEGIRDLRHEVSELAADLGIEAPTALETLYQVLSAMPELVERPAEALEVLRVALKVAATGFAEGETAARAITAILNAFNLEASEAERVSDALFAAQNAGVLTFGEIATEIGKVSNLTSSMNADFEDLLGILATITPSGENVSQTMTQIRSVLRELLDPTEELNEALAGDATGFVSDRGLLAALQRIAEVTEGDPQLISQMFGRGEAVQLVNSLAQQMGTLEEKTQGVRQAAGETEGTLDQMTDSIKRQKERARELWQHDLRLWGEGYERLGTQGLKAFNDMHAALQELLDLVEDMKAAPGEIADAYEQTFHERIPRAISSTLRELADLPPLPPREGEALRGETDPRSPRPALTGPSGGERTPGPRLERPESPAGAFAEDIEEFAGARQLQAMFEFMESGDLERYQAALRGIQLEVNELVEAQARRLRGMGATASELQPLLSLFDQEVEKYRNLKLELTPLADATRDFFLAMRELPDVVGPDVEGFRQGAGGMLEVDPDQGQKLAELRRFTEDLIDSGRDADEMWSDLQEKIDDLGLTYENLDTSILMNIRSLGLSELALAALGFEVEGLDDDAEGLQGTLDDIEGTARGLLSVADAAGVLSEELRQGLQGAIDLAGAIRDIDADGLSIGNLSQGIGGAISLGTAIIGGFFGGEDPEARRLRKSLEDNARAVDQLRQEFEKQRAFFGSFTGEEIEALEDFTALPPSAFGATEHPFDEDEWVGFDFEGFRDQLNAMGLDLEDLEQAAEILGITWEENAIVESFLKLGEALRELELERALSTFEGQMDLLQREIELFDIEDPIDQLRKMRKLFLDFADLPEELEAEMEGINLETAEGRARLEGIIQDIFRQITSGEFDTTQFGKLTLDQLLDMLGRLESTIDEAEAEAGGGPSSRSFQVVNTIQEVTANEMVGYLSTMDVRLAHIAEAMGREGFGTPIRETGSAPLPAGVGGGKTVNVTQSIQQSFDTDVGPITVELEDGSEASAEELLDNLEKHVDRKLGETYRRVTEDYGSLPTVERR